MKTKNKSPWGYHLIVDCSGCNKNVENKSKIFDFNEELIRKIRMKAFGKPIIEYLLPGHKNQGYSLLQLIHTSNISAHFMDLSSTAYFDVFSCKKFDPKTAVQIIKKYFKPKKIKVNFIERQAPDV